jgi:hypothetical protein
VNRLGGGEGIVARCPTDGWYSLGCASVEIERDIPSAAAILPKPPVRQMLRVREAIGANAPAMGEVYMLRIWVRNTLAVSLPAQRAGSVTPCAVDTRELSYSAGACEVIEMGEIRRAAYDLNGQRHSRYHLLHDRPLSVVGGLIQKVSRARISSAGVGENPFMMLHLWRRCARLRRIGLSGEPYRIVDESASSMLRWLQKAVVRAKREHHL